MKIAVSGATGTIGTPVADALVAAGHEVRALSRSAPRYAVDLTTGDGLAEALDGCDVLVDASNGGPAREPAEAVLIDGGRRLLAAARDAGIKHHVCISIVGVEKVPLPYYRVKVEQERLVEASGIPYTILRATQFHQLLIQLFESAARFRVIPGGSSKLQPCDPREAAAVIAELAAGEPRGGRVNFTGPHVLTLRELARDWRGLTGSHVFVSPTPIPGKLGKALRGGALTHLRPDHQGRMGFGEWLARRV